MAAILTPCSPLLESDDGLGVNAPADPVFYLSLDDSNTDQKD
jgi:hypothetical protein